MALRIGAQPAVIGQVAMRCGWERYADDFGSFDTMDDYERDNYPFSIMVNSEGHRFLDEGADIRNYTYAKYGRIILQQPGQFAWQIFDLSVTHMLRPEYRARRVTKVTANSIEELADKLEDVNRDALIETIKTFNASITRCAVQPQRQGRPSNARSRHSKVELGGRTRESAVRGLRGDMWDHVHLWRP